MLSHTEMPSSLQGAEEAIKKHEDFLTTMEASEEKITGVVEAGRRLVNDLNANSDKIQEKADSIQERHQKNREAANELLSKLKDNRELQHFLQDGQEVRIANCYNNNGGVIHFDTVCLVVHFFK